MARLAFICDTSLQMALMTGDEEGVLGTCQVSYASY